MVQEIYLDNAATTQVDARVADEVITLLVEDYANASSSHAFGKRVAAQVQEAREKIASYIGASRDEIIFTSGGTESNNLAIRGLAKAHPEKKHIITSVIEHPCVLETCKDLEKEGYEVDYIGVNEEGLIDFEELTSKIKEDTLLVSIMHVNNEIGTIQPIEKIGSVCKKKGVYFHSDAVQSFTKLDIDVKKIGLSLMSVSGHKVFAPKGIGFLYVSKDVFIKPLFTGGRQEYNLRSGTINSPGIIGLAAALDVSIDKKAVKNSRDLLLEKLQTIDNIKINGALGDSRIYNNINVSFYGVEAEGLILKLEKEGIFVSSGSACSSTKVSASHVLEAIGVEELYIHGSIRITLGKPLSDEVILFVFETIQKYVAELKSLSPFK